MDLFIKKIKSICPYALTSYIDAFENHSYYLNDYGISNNKLILCHFLSQVIHETQHLQKQEENLSYRADRLVQVWPKRFKPRGPHDPYQYEKNPQKLANLVYGGRMGNIGTNDGYLFRGRSFPNLTGKSMYYSIYDEMKDKYSIPNFVSDPDSVNNPKYSLGVACSFWKIKGCSSFAIKDDINSVTERYNGGLIGIVERKSILSKVKAVFL